MTETFIPEILTKLGTGALMDGGKYTASVCHTCEYHAIYGNMSKFNHCKICIVTERGQA